MAVMAQWGLIPEEAKHTADFIEKMDQLFSCFNSMTITSSAKMRQAVSNSSGHVDYLKHMLQYMKAVQCKSGHKLPCLQGWQISINALLMLWEVLRVQHGFEFLLTNRLNQDCIENLFSLIRAKGAQRDNPDAGQFRAAFRQVMVDNVMVPSKSANCEADVDSFICSLKHVKEAPSTSTVTEHVSIMDQVPVSVKAILSVCTSPDEECVQGLSNQENNVLAYIAGYIVRKVKGKVCAVCCDKITGELDSNPNLDFLKSKTYGYLSTPSKLLLGVVQLLELEYRKAITSVIYKVGLKATLVERLGKTRNLQMFECENCHLDILVLHLVVNIRLHHTIREINEGLRANKDRKNRKTIKFLHL